MNPKLSLGLLLVTVATAASSTPRTPQKPDFLRAKLEAMIAAAGGNRTAGSPGNLRALAWLKAEGAKLKGWQVDEQTFVADVDYAIKSYQADLAQFLRQPRESPAYERSKRVIDALTQHLESLRGKKGTNLILRKRGSDPKLAKEIVVVSAHFDTITTMAQPFTITADAPAPGADDNGAAVVAALELARELDSLKPRRTVEIVFFDFEEQFFLGSYFYARELAKRGIQASNVNLEMIGYDERMPRSVRVYIRSQGHPGWVGDAKIAKVLEKELKAEKLLGGTVKNNFANSDNWSFWKHLHSAATVSQDWESGFNHAHYHQSSDTPDTIDWAYVLKIERAIVKSVRELIQH